FAGEFPETNRGLAGRRRPALAVLMRHRRHPADQVSKVVGEIDVVPFLVPLPREIAVAAVGDLFHQIQPQRIGAELRGDIRWIEAGAERLAHPLATEVHPSVPEDLLW